MPRMRNLKGVAAGLVTTFISRNNDINGYWGIGVLCRDAVENDGKVSLNLIEGVASPATSSCAYAVKVYMQRLEDLLCKAGFIPTVLIDAGIELKFGGATSHYAQEVMVTCLATLTDNKKRRYEATCSGHCWPHDRVRELRSTRANSAQDG